MVRPFSMECRRVDSTSIEGFTGLKSCQACCWSDSSRQGWIQIATVIESIDYWRLQEENMPRWQLFVSLISQSFHYRFRLYKEICRLISAELCIHWRCKKIHSGRRLRIYARKGTSKQGKILVHFQKRKGSRHSRHNIHPLPWASWSLPPNIIINMNIIVDLQYIHRFSLWAIQFSAYLDCGLTAQAFTVFLRTRREYVLRPRVCIKWYISMAAAERRGTFIWQRALAKC